MIDGSPFNKLVAINDEPSPPAAAAEQERKLRVATGRRHQESPRARAKRIAQYQRERRQDHALMAEMIKAFNFKLDGEDTIRGHRCFVLEATPRPDYQPVSRDTRVLKGMRGKMWVDEQQYQWVKVQAEVFRPVAFGLFIAHVEPGTRFLLEQEPVEGHIWLPSHFAMQVKAKILFAARNSTDDETYTEYRRAAPGPSAANKVH
jgi:hypothetical protein